MSSSFVVACVGKPSAGKSSFLNAVSDAVAKVGNYPFTTIEPNKGVAYYKVLPNALAEGWHIIILINRFQKEHLCKPRHGKCIMGNRYIPIQMLDVAGLVPGASEGKGLGNQFLDDLRHASVLVHVVDASGSTNEKGEATVGYDPSNDIKWLISEIHAWIFNNLKKNWPNVVRRHNAKSSTLEETLQNQWSGYGATPLHTIKVLVLLSGKIPENISIWDDTSLNCLVETFIKVRFPMIIALNKADLTESNHYIENLYNLYPEYTMIVCSALAETFLRKLDKQGFLAYVDGTDTFYTLDNAELVPKGYNKPMKELDERTKSRLEKVQDLVLYRFGNTGVQEVIQSAVELGDMIPVYPVSNINNFTSGDQYVFRDVILTHSSTRIKDISRKIGAINFTSVVTIGNVQISDFCLFLDRMSHAGSGLYMNFIILSEQNN
ncbi:P-loop containing nucleoside triphosphate hydrolase protein [Rozella allomycis CSF55]|uniref:P-loop containing nucleoside triphosphate hydrolase protein n=1 Tax=Rozella allomycis (strain CSF55) TaxID=988480 RepID=A0A4P9YHV0_ROZAC|nr:P-loop containing nucleoside triphosphate hydrolase protein [Rozella allomycis CSF55]